MAKFENELDIAKAKRSVSRFKQEITHAFTDPDIAKILKKIVDNKSITCYIFAKSVAFRIGKSSIKTIEGYSDGLKSSFPSGKESKDIFENYTFNANITKSSLVFLLASWFILYETDRVKSESDKTEAVESEQVLTTQNQLKKMVKEYGVVKLKVGDHYYDVDDFSQVSGRPKADMIFTLNKQPVIYVSHKKGSKPGDFQQYGGFAADLGIKNRVDAKKYPAIDKFLTEVEEVLKGLGVSKDKLGRYDFNQLQKGSNFAKLIDDANVAYVCMFGKDYQTKKVGLDNCSVLIDGDIVFSPIKGKSMNVFTLEGSYHTTVNPCLLKSKPNFKSDANDIYAPAMFLIKSEAQGLNQAGFANVRAVIWPNNNVVKGYSAKFKDIHNAIKSKNKNKIDNFKKTLVK